MDTKKLNAAVKIAITIDRLGPCVVKDALLADLARLRNQMTTEEANEFQKRIK